MSSLYCFRSSTNINANTINEVEISDVSSVIGYLIDNAVMCYMDDNGYTLFFTSDDELFDEQDRMLYLINMNSSCLGDVYISLRSKVLSTLRSEKIEKII